MTVQVRPLTVAPLLLVCGALLGACGGSDDGTEQPAGATSQPAPAPAPDPLAIPPGVPLRASRDGDPPAVRVIRRWSDALRRSDIAGASALWAVPSKIQNATPVLTLSSAGDVRSFNSSLTCGSRLVAARGAEGGFTIATLKLTRRPGADCGSGTGHHARTAILVRAGRIVEWYRLPSDPDAPGPQSTPPDQLAPLQDDAPAI